MFGLRRSLAMLLLAVVPSSSGLAEAPKSAVVDEAWNAAFTRTADWNGGDVAGSVELGDGRTLWLFGDTFVGRVADGKRRPGTVMVNNSAALQTHCGLTPAERAMPPTAETLHFFTGRPDAAGKPTALFPPTRAADADVNTELRVDEEYWPTGGGCTLEVGGKRRLYVGLFRIRKPRQDGGTWGFRRVGNSLGVIDDVSLPPEQWTTRVRAMPMAVGDPAQRDAAAAPPAVSFGEVFLPYAVDGVAGFIIYGVRTPPRGKRQLIAAFAAADGLDMFDRWRYFAGGVSWSADVADAYTLCDDMAPEFSIERVRSTVTGGFDGLVMVQNEPLLGAGILVRHAGGPLSSWSPPREAFRPGEPAADKGLFSYAAKGHAALSPAGELLISYVVSAHDFWRLFREPQLYRPRFVRVPLGDFLPRP